MNNFIIGIIGNKFLILNIKKIIDNFVINNLKLNLQKNKIIDKNFKGFKFFGYSIFMNGLNKKNSLILFDQTKNLNKFRNYLLLQLKNFNKIINKLIHYNFKIFLLEFYIKIFQLNFFKFDKSNINFIFKYVILLLNNINVLKRSKNNRLNITKNNWFYRLINNNSFKLSYFELKKVKIMKNKFITKINLLLLNTYNIFLKKYKINYFNYKKIIQLINLLQCFLKNFDFRSVDIKINKNLKTFNSKKYKSLLKFNNNQTIKIYFDRILQFLLYYRAVNNFEIIKKKIVYLHKNFILMLAKKHKKSKA